LPLLVSPITAMSARRPACPLTDDATITIFLTGNELGAMQPCGCSGGQLGGLDRRRAVWQHTAARKRLILDTGLLVESDSKQDLIKFNIIVQALALLDYDLVNLTETDVDIAKKLGLLEDIGTLFDVISPPGPPDVNLPKLFTKHFSFGSGKLAVRVGSLDTKLQPLEQLLNIFSGSECVPCFDVLIVNDCNSAVIEAAKTQPFLDCLICPAESDHPKIIGDAKDGPLVITAGQLGRYVGRLQIKPGAEVGTYRLSFSAVPVTEDLPRQESLVELYAIYQQFVKDAAILTSLPRLPLANGFEYTGSASCMSCHQYEYEKWSTGAHARAYATLEQAGSEYDPECVKCHVVGMEYESGFISPELTGQLKNVGCENCHGPGSRHIETEGEILTGEPKSTCMDCHSPDHSADYAGNEQTYFEKIVHWREPNARSDVKD